MSVHHRSEELVVFREFQGAEASAGIYTLIETAKVNGLNPRKYIQYILSEILGSDFKRHPEFLEDYLPWNAAIQKCIEKQPAS